MGQLIRRVDKNKIKFVGAGGNEFQYIGTYALYGCQVQLFGRIVDVLNTLEVDVYGDDAGSTTGRNFEGYISRAGAKLQHIRPFKIDKIGRASCRARGCPNVYISVVAGYIKKKQK